MFEKYIATEDDFRAIETGIEACWSNDLKRVFPQKKYLTHILIISYDCRFLYFWKSNDAPYHSVHAKSIPAKKIDYRVYKIPHNLKKVPDNVQFYWRNGLIPKQLDPLLRKVIPRDYRQSIVSGGLLVPFISLQKQKQRQFNPYISLPGYMATIVHEIAHAYFNQHRLGWFSSKRKNLRLLRTAKALYKASNQTDIAQLKLHIPNYGVRDTLLGEAFAFCAEYTAAKHLWHSHVEQVEKSNPLMIDRLIEIEKGKDLIREESVLAQEPGHIFAAIIGRLLLEQSPKTWASRLLNSTII